MVGIDQGIRYVSFSDSTCLKEYYKSEMQVDTNQFNSLVDLIKEHGWLNFNLIGSGMNNVELIMWHNRDKYNQTQNWKYLIEVIKKQIEIGEYDQRVIATYEDWIYYKKNKMQLYGTLVMYSNGKTVYQPIYDIKNVDKRRKGMGLGDLKTNALIRDAELPEGYEYGSNNK
jgi:hypothetical protein